MKPSANVKETISGVKSYYQKNLHILIINIGVILSLNYFGYVLGGIVGLIVGISLGVLLFILIPHYKILTKEKFKVK